MNDLPTEIILKIADYLSLSNMHQCLYICRKWNQTFKYVFYNSVTIHSSKQLDAFLTAVKQSAATTTALDKPIGHLVKLLRFCGSRHTCIHHLSEETIIIPHSFTEQLPALCPNLTALAMGPAEWLLLDFHSNLRIMRHLKRLPTFSTTDKLPFLLCIGEALTTLSVNGTLLTELLSQRCLLSTVLSMVPNLKELIFGGEEEESTMIDWPYYTDQTNLTIEHLECIHYSLPKLQVLKIQGRRLKAIINEKMEEKVLRQSRAVEPAHSMCAFHLTSTPASSIWLIYVSYKYPKLRKLTIAISGSTREQNEWVTLSRTNRSFEKSALQSLLDKCKHLESITLCCSTLDNWINPSFLSKLQQMHNLKEVRPLKKTTNTICNAYQLMAAAEYGKTLLTALDVYNLNLYETMEQLKHFRNLMKLDLHGYTYDREYCLETILDSCPRLEYLGLEGGFLSTPPDNVKCGPLLQQHHCRRKQTKLRCLHLTRIAFRSANFVYLGKKCPSIVNLTLKVSKCLCEVDNLRPQSVIEINMPHHSFHSISIDRVALDRPSASLFYPAWADYIRIVFIETEKWKRWYQHTRYTEPFHTPVSEQLDPFEAVTVTSYFADVEKTGNNATKSDSIYDVIRGMGYLKVNDALKTNLLFGYVKLRCATVENLQIHGNVRRER